MRLLRCSTLLAVLWTAGCSSKDDSGEKSSAVTASSDCLGPDSAPAIDVGRVGALRLDLTVRELRRLCPMIKDTIAHGEEMYDTAIVISRPGLSVVGRLATVADDQGYHAWSLDSSQTIARWTIYGTRAMLPGKVPIAAPWDSLVRAYGKAVTYPLNGRVFVWFCSGAPEFTFNFDDPWYSDPNREKRDSTPHPLAGKALRTIDVPSTHLPPAERRGCSLVTR